MIGDLEGWRWLERTPMGEITNSSSNKKVPTEEPMTVAQKQELRKQTYNIFKERHWMEKDEGEGAEEDSDFCLASSTSESEEEEEESQESEMERSEIANPSNMQRNERRIDNKGGETEAQTQTDSNYSEEEATGRREAEREREEMVVHHGVDAEIGEDELMNMMEGIESEEEEEELEPEKEEEPDDYETLINNETVEPIEAIPETAAFTDTHQIREKARASMKKKVERRKGYTPSGLPAWLGYFGKRRPDGIIIKNLRWQDRQKGPSNKRAITVHLVEFTFTSEQSMVKAQLAKLRQYKEITEALEKNGWKVLLHTLVMGVRGWMPQHTWEELGRLGISKAKRKELYNKLSRLAVNSLISCVNTRRKMEVRGNREKTNKVESGFVRFTNDREVHRKAKAKEKKRLKRLPANRSPP
jgi:hypothetical protein